MHSHRLKLLALAGLFVIATPFSAQASLYAPGATTDPDCGPHDSNCGVATSTLAAASPAALYWNAANEFLGVGTSSPFTTLSVAGNGYFSGSIKVGDSGTTRSNFGLSYATSSDIVTIATWGDSLMYGSGGTSWPSQLSNLLGQPVYNGGVNGATSTAIAANMLAATDKYSWPTIIWSGRNDITGSLSTDEPIILSNIASMVAALQSVGNSRYLVMGIINRNNETVGTANHDEIVQINSDLAALYGANYWDVRAYLISQYNPANPQDVIDYGNDVTPTSLRAEPLHPNAAGNLKIAQWLQQHSSLLLPTASSAVLTTQNLTLLFNNPYAFSSVDTVSGFKQGGNVVLSFSPGSQSVAVGSPDAAAWMSATSSSFGDVAIGLGALKYAPLNANAANNTALGANTLTNVTTGGYNLASGWGALYLNTTGGLNVANGVRALYYNTTGSTNVAVGASAMYQNISGTGNISVGNNALYANTTGTNNVALGSSALSRNVTGNSNIAIGYQVANFAATSTNNIAIGYQAAYGAGVNYTNQNGIYIGYRSGYSVATSSDYNTFLGYQSGYQNTTGYGNIMVGAQPNAGLAGSITTGWNNIGIGYNARFASSTASNQLSIGNFVFGTLPATTTASSFALPTTGNFAVGSSSPYAEFGIHANSGATYRTLFAIGSSTAIATTTLFSVANTGDVTINGSSGSTCTIGNGTGGTSCTSDESLKTNIALIVNPLEGIERLRGVTFNWKDQTKDQSQFIGVVAQDVQKVFPQAVSRNSDGYLSVDYGSLVAPLIEAVKEIGSISGGFESNLVAWLGNAGNGLTNLFASNVHATKELCVGGTCITGAQLQQMLDQQGIKSAPIIITDGPSAPSGDSGDQASKYAITVTQADHGIIGPETLTDIESGANVSFGLTPEAGYDVATLVIDGQEVATSTTYDFTNITANHTIQASFAQLPVAEQVVEQAVETGDQ